MANKKVKYTYQGINQDVSRSKHQPQFYFEGGHIRIMSTDTQATGSISNEKGTEVVIVLPEVKIIGQVNPAVIANVLTDEVIVSTSTITSVLTNDYFVHDVTVTITVQPSKGNVVINTDNTITYTNTDGIIGTDSYTYKIDDGVTNDTAIVTMSVVAVLIVDPTDDTLDEDTWDTNYDGNYYYYKFAPCNITLSFMDVKSVTKITDNNVYGILGSGGIGREGKIAYKINPIVTHWTIGLNLGTICPSDTLIIK